VKAEAAGPAWVRILGNSARFRVAPFDTLAAVEAATMTAEAIKAGDKLGGVQPGSNVWQKVKFDRQIIAVSRVQGATVIYSHDPDMKTLVGPVGPQVLSLADLPLPPQDAQIDWLAEAEDENQ
jgi:hypothetical protein